MSKKFFTIVGANHYYGQDFFERGMTVKLVKETDNEVDKEAIRVELEGLGLVGYVANSSYTVIGESYSAGRLYDKIGETAEGTVLYVLPKGIICCVKEEDIIKDTEKSSDADPVRVIFPTREKPNESPSTQS